MQIVNTFLCVAGTVLTYALVRRLYLRYKHPLINIVAGSAAIIITVLLLCDIPYATYEPARQVMTLLLGPATVALALPLYRYRHLLYTQYVDNTLPDRPENLCYAYQSFDSKKEYLNL